MIWQLQQTLDFSGPFRETTETVSVHNFDGYEYIVNSQRKKITELEIELRKLKIELNEKRNENEILKQWIVNDLL
jgi:hypothetical protein